jgi:hypothetical protein
VVRDNGERAWDKPEKSTDLIDFETIFLFTLGWVVDPYASGRFESQWQDVTLITTENDTTPGPSLFLNPLKFKESGGVARRFIQEEDRELISRVGFTFRQSYRRFYVDPRMSDETTSETTNDGGFEWITDYKTNVLQEKVAWTTKLTVYQPVFYSFSDRFDDVPEDSLLAAGLPADVKDYPRAVDMSWENIFTSQITSYLSVNLYVMWLYDKYDNTVPPVLTADGLLENPDDVRAAIRKGGQFKQTLSIGLTYRFL